MQHAQRNPHSSDVHAQALCEAKTIRRPSGAERPTTRFARPQYTKMFTRLNFKTDFKFQAMLRGRSIISNGVLTVLEAAQHDLCGLHPVCNQFRTAHRVLDAPHCRRSWHQWAPLHRRIGVQRCAWQQGQACRVVHSNHPATQSVARPRYSHYALRNARSWNAFHRTHQISVHDVTA